MKTCAGWTIVAGCLLMFWGCLLPAACRAEIYMYVDETGMRRFTNVPINDGRRVFIQTSVRKRERRSESRFDSLIHKAALRYGVPPHLVKAVIKAESGFDEAAVSRKGAKGLMQLMPDNIRAYGIRDPFSPYENIMAGTLHLSQLVKRFNGSLSLALAAYNAGAHAVERYNNTIPPYPETLRYVRKVLAFYQEFSST